MQALKEQEVQLSPRATHTVVSRNMEGYSCLIHSHPLKDEGKHMETGTRRKAAGMSGRLRTGTGAEEEEVGVPPSRAQLLLPASVSVALENSGPVSR